MKKFLTADVTEINAMVKNAWVHTASSDLFTFCFVDEKRGRSATDKMDIIPKTNAILVHDHFKAYYGYEGKTHALCNEHHKREPGRQLK